MMNTSVSLLIFPKKNYMKLINVSCAKQRCIFIIVIITISVLFTNCSEMYISSWDCTEDEEHECAHNQYSNTKKRSLMDILIVIDTSDTGQELNDQITSNLSQFLKCVKPTDWRVGVISSMEKDNSQNGLGDLMHLEIDGETSSRTFITAKMENHQKTFSDTISLQSGCSYPPYCGRGAHIPLSAVKSFMQKERMTTEKQDSFLREHAPLTIVIVSSSDEKTDSESNTNSQSTLTAIEEYYSADQFIGLVVTDSGEPNNCIKTTKDHLSNGLDFIGKTAAVVGMFTNPLISIGGFLITNLLSETIEDTDTLELVKFAKQTGGHTFDICKGDFGHTLAYSALQKLDMADQIPDECGDFAKPQTQSAQNGKDD